jgi:DNA-binding response OmpR family regulator
MAIEQRGSKPVHNKILVVDDNHDVCRTIADMLSASGAQIYTAFDGAEALSVLGGNKLDLAIVDLLFGGPVSSDIVVQHAKLHRCPVITMSGTLASDRRGRDLGTPHLIKPFGTQQLVSLIEKTLADRGRQALVLS